jgi:hypothetical protein
MSSLFLLLSFIAIVLVALWSIEQEKLSPDERGYSGLFGIKRPSTLPAEPPARKKTQFAFGRRNAPPTEEAPSRLKEEDLAVLFRHAPKNGE